MCDNKCEACEGTGIMTYPNTATWNDGPDVVSGQAITLDTCYHCWGSGDDENPWPNLRDD